MPYQRIDDPAQLRRLLEAVMLIESDLSLPSLLRHLVEEASALVNARYGALGVLNEARTALDEFITVGLSTEEEQAIGPRPTGRGVLGLLIVDPQPLRLANLGEHPDRFGFPANHPAMTSFLGVPIQVRGEVYGNLYLTEKRDQTSFTEEDEAMVSALGLAAGIAIENARLHRRVQEMTLLEDRDRIARDLHDTVIQRLFATGLALQGVAGHVQPAAVAQRIEQAVEDLDDTIRKIRTTIFDLGEQAHDRGLRRDVLDLVGDLVPLLGLEPEVAFVGPVDTLVKPAMADHLLAALREALTNIGKHAGARQVSVTVSAGEDLCLVVADDGCGIDLALVDGGGLGLRNLRSRAQRHGGELVLEQRGGGGTQLVWKVPLHG